jgi:hypothetical protein
MRLSGPCLLGLVPASTTASPARWADSTDLPDDSQVLSVEPSGASAWAFTLKITARLRDDTIKHYFMKVLCLVLNLVVWTY